MGAGCKPPYFKTLVMNYSEAFKLLQANAHVIGTDMYLHGKPNGKVVGSLVIGTVEHHTSVYREMYVREIDNATALSLLNLGGRNDYDVYVYPQLNDVDTIILYMTLDAHLEDLQEYQK